MSCFNNLVFRQTWQKYPENLLFFPVSVLRKGMGSCFEAKTAVIAELFVRVFLSNDRNSEEAQIIRELLPDGELDGFMSLFSGSEFRSESLDSELWIAKSDFSQCCQAAVRKRFRRLFSADGLIPVYNTDGSGQAFLIPFSFKEDADGARGVFTLDGHEVTEWSECAKRLGIPCVVRLHCHQDGNEFPLKGSSLMLPLQMAWWRKERNLPEYNVFRLVATGSFDESLRLASVQTEEKARAVFSQLHDAYFLCPESDSQTSRRLHCLPLVGRTALLEKIRKVAEKLDKLDMPYVLQRIDAFGREVNLNNYNRWDELIKRLEHADVFDRRREQDADSYLSILMLRSTACRHAGRTAEAKKLNIQARQFASKHGDKYVRQLLRLEIDNLVNLTDEGEIESAEELGGGLVDALERLKDTDLWMRFHGTMGQVYSFGTLMGLQGFTSSQARSHFEQALNCAYALGSEAEIAHDLNYLHLYFAFFAPGTEEEQTAFDDAKKQLDRLNQAEREQQEKGNAEKNLSYLKRSQSLAWYRLLLTNNVPPRYETSSFQKLLLETSQGTDDWLRCCIAKYLGALEAASGNMDSARNYFQAAVSSIAPNQRQGVKALILLAAFAEAYRSLHEESFRYEAIALLNGSPDLLNYTIAREFRDFLTKDAPFPALRFWY